MVGIKYQHQLKDQALEINYDEMNIVVIKYLVHNSYRFYEISKVCCSVEHFIRIKLKVY